jgi:hypothetical protein
MAYNSFTPNSKIKSAEVNANFQNISDHCRNVTFKWTVKGAVTTQTINDIMSVPDDVNWNRVDLFANTAPTGQALIVDIERSTDGGGTWVTIFTGGTNRPQIAAASRIGNTTTIDVPAATQNTHLFRAKVSQVGSTVPGSDLSIMLKGTYTFD